MIDFASLTGAFLFASVQVAGSSDLPKIAAPTPTAQFTGNGGALKLDPACRDFTLATLSTDPACAARVARGEIAPILAVSAHTMVAAKTTSERDAVLGLLEKAIAAENHPAAHYLIGSLLTSGERFAPDYERGISHLEKAVAGGNVAAADLLGVLVLEGRGTAQNPQRASTLIERAATGGMPGSSARLALLHLQGWLLPKDEPRARGILEAAVAAGDPSAGRLLQMLEVREKVTNFQLHPRADGPPQVRRYSTFDNPRIPPAFGFTDEFRQVHYSGITDAAILARLEREQQTLPTPYLYELARRIAPRSPEKGRAYWMLARLRMSYDAMRCADPQALQAINGWDRLILPDIRFALVSMSPTEMRVAVEYALEREASMPADRKPWWVCYSGMEAYSASLASKPVPLKLRDEAEWPAIRAKARTDLQALLAAQSTQ